MGLFSGFTRSIKKIGRKFERAVRPFVKIGAVAAASYFVPGSTSVVAGAVFKPKVSQTMETQPFSEQIYVPGPNVMGGQIYSGGGAPGNPYISPAYETGGAPLAAFGGGGGDSVPSGGISPMYLVVGGIGIFFLFMMVILTRR